METKIAINIETEIFYSIISFLKENNWSLDIEYDEKIFDKGIDFDFYQFHKNEEIISLAWCNWFEGEMKGTLQTLNGIADHFDFQIHFGEPEYLHQQNIIEEMKGLLKYHR